MQKGLHQEFIIKLSEVKNKWRILKAAREKQLNIQGSPHKTENRFLNGNFAGSERVE